MNKVCVVIPAYNSEKYLQDCLDGRGLKSSKYHVDIVVVDNGSTDMTSTIASERKVRVISAKRTGAAAARNAGISSTESEYIAFLDSDCVPIEGWLDRLVDALSTSLHVGIGGHIQWKSEKCAFQNFYERNYPSNLECSNSIQPTYLLTGNAIFKRYAIEEVGGFNTTLPWCEDLDIGLRMSHEGFTFGYCAGAVVEINTPHTLLDLYSQFYKYGVGNQHIQSLHSVHGLSRIIDDWQSLIDAAKHVSLTANDSTLRLYKFITQLAYLSGRLDGAIRIRNLKHVQIPIVENADLRQGCVVTIDDSPHPNSTPAILKILQRHKIIATFFINGARAKSNQVLLRHIYEAGHELCNHGYSHRRFDTLSANEIHEELSLTEDILRGFRPTPSPYPIRLPYGAGLTDPFVHNSIQKWRDDATLVHWTQSFEEWAMCKSYNSIIELEQHCSELVSSKLLQIPKKGTILLFHDSPIGVSSNYIGDACRITLEKAVQILRNSNTNISPLNRLRDPK